MRNPILEQIRQYAYSTLRGKIFTNRHTGYPIRVNRRGIDHTLRHVPSTPEGRLHALSVKLLGSMLENARYLGSEPNTDPLQARSLRAIHRFQDRATIDNQPLLIRLVVKEAPDGYFFYDHHTEMIEPAAP